MHVSQLFHAFPSCPYVEIVESSLPERGPLCFGMEHTALSRARAPLLRRQGTGGALLKNLHDGRRSSDLGLADEQVDMFRHDDVSHDHEAEALAGLFKNLRQTVAENMGTDGTFPDLFWEQNWGTSRLSPYFFSERRSRRISLFHSSL